MEVRTKTYIIPGNPVAWARPGAYKGKFYDTQKNIKLIWGIHLTNQHDDEPLFEGPLAMSVIFFMPIPPSKSDKVKEQLKNQWHFYKPDLSNLLKLIEDIATTICYKDDSLLVKEYLEKVYDDGNGPRTEITITELKGRR